MKIVFFGSGDFIKPVIKSLEKNFELVQIVTPQTELKEKADLGVIASYGSIISPETINNFPYGIINIHPSLLPKYRGPTPVQTSILNGDKKTGITIIKIDNEVDHGPILTQEELDIKEGETSESLLKRSFELGARMLPAVISKYIKGQLKESEQDHSKATFTQHLTKESGFISLNNAQPADLLKRMISAYYPWPGVWFRTYLGDQVRIVKLLPGQKIQVEGKKPMSYKDFVNGYKEGKAVISGLGV